MSIAVGLCSPSQLSNGEKGHRLPKGFRDLGLRGKERGLPKGQCQPLMTDLAMDRALPFEGNVA